MFSIPFHGNLILGCLELMTDQKMRGHHIHCEINRKCHQRNVDKVKHQDPYNDATKFSHDAP